MAEPPSTLLIIDFSALELSKTREWHEYSRVGVCFIPQVVFDEIRFLSDRAPDINVEQTAREFMRFYPESGWHLTAISATHSSLKPASGDAFSKKARLSQAVAQCAYGMARNHPGSLVVLVTTDQPLLQKIQAIGAPNLCGVTQAALRQWARTQRPPLAVAQQLRTMQTAVLTAPGASGTHATPKMTPTPQRASSVKSRPSTPARRHSSARPNALSQILSALLMLGALGVAGLIGWSILQPDSFNQFWQKTGLPTLSGDTPNKKP